MPDTDGLRDRIRRRMADEGCPVGSDNPTLQALGAPPEHIPLRAFTKYICPVGHGQLGHSSIWTGAYEHPMPSDAFCMCGETLVTEESTKDGHRYRLTFESIDPVQAATFEQHYGPAIWRNLSDREWDNLLWHEVSREADAPGDIEAQYRNLLMWERTHEQPIRNVRLERAVAVTSWEPFNA